MLAVRAPLWVFEDLAATVWTGDGRLFVVLIGPIFLLIVVFHYSHLAGSQASPSGPEPVFS